MIDGLNVVFATRTPAQNSGQNTHEGGIAVMMTGVPVLGGSASRTTRRGARRSISCCSTTRRCWAGPTQMDKTPFGSLQLAADVRSDRDEVAPRTLSYRPPLSGSERHLARRGSPWHPTRSRSTSTSASSAAPIMTGIDPATDPGPEEVGARLHARRSRADADADSRRARRIGWRRTPPRSRSSRRASGRRTARRAGNGRLHEAGDAAQLRRE